MGITITMEEPYIYTDLNEVPLRWRTYKGARLSLTQINKFIAFAYDNKFETEEGDIPNYAAGKEYLESLYEPKNSVWVLKGDDN